MRMKIVMVIQAVQLRLNIKKLCLEEEVGDARQPANCSSSDKEPAKKKKLLAKCVDSFGHDIGPRLI